MGARAQHHRYSRPPNRHRDDHDDWWKLDRRSIRRARHLRGISRSRSPAVIAGLNGAGGLGSRRTLRDFEAFAGVSFKRQRITTRGRAGRFG